MAFGGQKQYIRSYLAGADLSANTNQYRFVKAGTMPGTVVLCDAVTDRPIGVLHNTPDNGGLAEVCVWGPTKLRAGGALAAFTAIGTAADGEAEAKVPGTNTTHYVCGRTEHEAVSAAGDIIAALIDLINPARGA